jgi:hypothetical protein
MVGWMTKLMKDENKEGTKKAKNGSTSLIAVR